jgi:hypothetical protein
MARNKRRIALATRKKSKAQLTRELAIARAQVIALLRPRPPHVRIADSLQGVSVYSPLLFLCRNPWCTENILVLGPGIFCPVCQIEPDEDEADEASEGDDDPERDDNPPKDDPRDNNKPPPFLHHNAILVM